MARRKPYKKRRTYRRSYHHDTSLETLVFIIIVGSVLYGGVVTLDVSSWLPEFSGPTIDLSFFGRALTTVTPIVMLIMSVVLLAVLAIAGYRLWGVVKRITATQKRRQNIEHHFTTGKKRFSHLTWREFEFYVGALFKKRGYRFKPTPGQGDEGLDGFLYRDGKEYVMQAKHYMIGKNVGRPEVQQFVGAMVGYDGGFFVTSSSYTSGARAYAAEFGNRLVLIDGIELQTMSEESSLSSFKV